MNQYICDTIIQKKVGLVVIVISAVFSSLSSYFWSLESCIEKITSVFYILMIVIFLLY
jgi:hypothetical protein